MIAAPEFEDAEELLRQYSPSRWSKRIFASSDAVVMDHVNTLQGGSKAVLDEAIRKQGGKEDGSVVTLNVVHTSSDGATDEASLDIFYPLEKRERSSTSKGAERYPVLIYIHGGYWQALDKKSSCWHAKTFTENGIGFVAIGQSRGGRCRLSGHRAKRWGPRPARPLVGKGVVSQDSIN